MKHFTKSIKVFAMAFIGVMAVSCVFTCCQNEEIVDETYNEYGMLLDDNLVALKNQDGNITIKNIVTGETTIKDIKIDWTSSNPNDSLAVYCSNEKRGFYNVHTGKIAVEAQYRRAWHFSEGLAAVQRNGMIGFIDHSGNVVIPFNFPYHGNPLSSFSFKKGKCVVANKEGKCGVIDSTGNWLIEPLYDNVCTYDDYAIVSKAGIRLQVGYDKTIINSFVLDDINELTYEKNSVYVNNNGDHVEFTEDVSTGYFSYRIGGRCGLMTSDCKKLTEPLYYRISAINGTMFRAILLDRYSEVLINANGEVIK